MPPARKSARQPVEERHNIKETNAPIMFSINTSAFAVGMLEYIYHRSSPEESSPEDIAYCAERIKRMSRWFIRRYGPESGAALIETVLLAPRKVDSDIPGLGEVINTLFTRSYEEIYSES